MNLTPFFKSTLKSLCHEWCLQGHLWVSSQDLLMGQQVKRPLLTPYNCHGTQSRVDDWSSEGFEYPSGLEELTNLHLKAGYMTENHFRIKKTLASFVRSIHDSEMVVL
jgi:hypothetical protein